MTFKVNKEMQTTLLDMQADINEAWRNLDDIQTNLFAKIQAIVADINEARSIYSGKLEDAKRVVDQFADEMESEYDDKSERWQESERGELVREWIDEIRSKSDEIEELDDYSLEELELPEDISETFDPDSFAPQF